MSKLNNLFTFVGKIQEFENIQLSNQIDIFSYYLTKVEVKTTFTATEVKSCFDSLNLPPHSNISTYLNRSTKKSSKKKAKYFKKNNNFALTPSGIIEVEKNYLSIKKVKAPTDDLFPQSLFEGTREYVKTIAQEASICYDNGLFNGCSVLIRCPVPNLLHS